VTTGKEHARGNAFAATDVILQPVDCSLQPHNESDRAEKRSSAAGLVHRWTIHSSVQAPARQECDRLEQSVRRCSQNNQHHSICWDGHLKRAERRQAKQVRALCPRRRARKRHRLRARAPQRQAADDRPEAAQGPIDRGRYDAVSCGKFRFPANSGNAAIDKESLSLAV
jgi:hypothetical protein